MKVTIDIDTGGTFTDGYICGAGQVERIKVDTTPHDLTVGSFQIIERAARKLGFQSTEQMLKNTEVIRFSNTIGTNTILQKSGPKLGLIVSKGFEDSVYARNGSRNPVFEFIVSPDMVSGITGKIDSNGNILEDVDSEEIRRAVKDLLVKGARIIVVSLANSSGNPALERKAKEIIEIDYPKHYLGSVPVLVSTEVDVSGDDMRRTNAALLNAYMHREMVKFLYKADTDLSKSKFAAPLLIVHNWGGVASVSKTRAISTYHSGPVAGLFGAAHIGNLYGLKNLITFDVGGTSTDFGVAVAGKPFLTMESELGGIPTGLRLVEVTSVGVGGGSIARVENSALRVGPESAGATPGPACYALGGMEPTATDAAVVLGYIDPDYFLGGQRKLVAAKAREAIETKVAVSLRVGVEEAAQRILKEQASICKETIAQCLKKKKISSENAVMLSFGGAGGVYCADVADLAGITTIYVPPFASVFSAFGSSTMDIGHQYEDAVMLPLHSAGRYLADVASLNKKIEALERIALRDAQAEGFSPEEVQLSLEVQVSNSGSSSAALAPFGLLRFRDEKEVRSLFKAFQDACGVEELPGDTVLERIVLRASCSIPHPELPSFNAADQSPEAARKGIRKIFSDTGFREIPIYERKELCCGSIVAGAAIIESEDTTIRVPEGWQFATDKFLFGIMRRKEV